MGQPPLSGTMRVRVVIVGISAGVLVLVGVPLALVAVARDRGAGAVSFFLFIGVGLPAIFATLMWRQVRRWRRDPELRRRQPNRPAARILLFGNLAAVTIGNLARSLSGAEGWAGWAVGLGVAMAAAIVVFLVAKRQDPRLHLFRRPDPMPDGQEPEGAPERAGAPW